VSNLTRALILVFCATIWLAGCSKDKDKTDKPALLVPLVNRIEIKSLWHIKEGGEKPVLRLGLDAAVDGPRVFVASHKGNVTAYDLASGKELWQHSVRAPLSGGPGAADGLIIVGSSKGDVIALSAQDGTQRWRIRINSEILSAPAIGNGLVIVRAVDGRLHGLSARDGSENWVVDQQVPRLSLRGTSRPIIAGDLAICGFDNGRIVAVALGNGSTAWESPVGQSHGSTELQRLIDVDAPVVADGEDLFGVAYQGRVARMARENGQIVWARDLSSFRGLAVDENAVYVSTAEGDLVRIDRRTGVEQWRVKTLERRQLSAPVVYGGRVVVADMSGYVHWFDAAKGDPVARYEIGRKKRVSNPMIVAGDLLLAFTDSGELIALRAPALVAQ
jgi:outer membrane protein assembly factor BamB